MRSLADTESLGVADPYLVSALYASTMKGLEVPKR